MQMLLNAIKTQIFEARSSAGQQFERSLSSKEKKQYREKGLVERRKQRFKWAADELKQLAEKAAANRNTDT